jgi:hypothetical protein
MKRAVKKSSRNGKSSEKELQERRKKLRRTAGIGGSIRKSRKNERSFEEEQKE